MGYRDARLSPDGRHLLFRLAAESDRLRQRCGQRSPLRHRFRGRTAAGCLLKIYLYEAPTDTTGDGRLACVSCNPTGARPLGYAGIPPGTRTSNSETGGEHMPRVLSSDGSRVFFDSYDALVPQDTNGRLDVYEWERLDHGTCTATSATFSGASGGCVSLISSGTGSENSEFADASEDGSDVFFTTGVSLVAGPRLGRSLRRSRRRRPARSAAAAGIVRGRRLPSAAGTA